MSRPRGHVVDRVLGVRRRIIAAGVALTVLVSVTGGLVVIDQVDRIVRNSEFALLQDGIAEVQAEVAAGRVTDLAAPGTAEYVELRNADGDIVVSDFPGGRAPAGLSNQLNQLEEVQLGDTPYFVVEATASGDGGTWRITLARDARGIEDIRSSLVALLVVTLVIVDVAFALGIWILAAAVLRQVTRLRLAAERIAAGDSQELLPVPGGRDEIAALAETLNTLVLRLRANTERERQLVSDASHELRTPLAILQAQLELARLQDTSIEEYSRDLEGAERSVRRLAHIAASLLELSRVEAASAPGRSTLGELVDELAEAADRARLRVGARGIEVDYAEDVAAARLDLVAAIDVVEFGRIIDNLVSNSLAARGDTGSIRLELVADDAGLELRVDDTAGGMPAEFVEQALERFSRPPGGHGADGAGLGLAIVRRLVELGGGGVELENRPGDGLAVHVRLPLVPAAEDAAGE